MLSDFSKENKRAYATRMPIFEVWKSGLPKIKVGVELSTRPSTFNKVFARERAMVVPPFQSTRRLKELN